MKLSVKQLLPLVCAVCALGACSGSPKFSEVTGKEWLLIEVRVQPHNIIFDRSSLASEGFGNIFTLNFDAERLSGIGAPNRYTAPYTLDKNLAIKIQPAAGTLMTPIREPEKLKERDFFNYLQNASKWNFTKEGRFELYSTNESGAETVLVFSL